MKPPFPLLLLCSALASGAAWSQSRPAGGPAAQPLPGPAAADPAEPAVQRTVVEDEGSRISELRVRGQVQRITVQPKVGGAKAYEILPGEGGHAPGEGRGAAGQRVWQVLSF